MTTLRVTEPSAEAAVRGSAPYTVRLVVEDGEPVFSCSCPVGADGSFCKHVVTLALVATDPRTAEGPHVEPQVDVRAYLEGLEHEQLVELVLEIASADERTLARLRLDAARAVSGPPPLRAFLDAINDAFATDDYVSYREAYDYAEDAYERGGHYLRRGSREVSHQVAEYPLASLLIAGLAGFGLGLLVSRRLIARGLEPTGGQSRLRHLRRELIMNSQENQTETRELTADELDEAEIDEVVGGGTHVYAIGRIEPRFPRL